jgi:hypothetical protein
MPLKKAAGKSKASMQKAVSANIRELKKSETKRPQTQIIAIALRAAGSPMPKKKN